MRFEMIPLTNGNTNLIYFVKIKPWTGWGPCEKGDEYRKIYWAVITSHVIRDYQPMDIGQEAWIY